MKHIKFRVSPYPPEIHVCSLDFPIQTKLHVDPANLPVDKSFLADSMPAQSKRGTDVVLIRLPEKYDEETLWHECIHAAAYLLDAVGASFGADSMDTVIYPTEYIVRTIKLRFYGIGKKVKCSPPSAS